MAFLSGGEHYRARRRTTARAPPCSAPSINRGKHHANTLYAHVHMHSYHNRNRTRTRAARTHRFVTKGKATTTLRKSAKRLSEDACFSLAAEGKVLDFAVPATVPDDGKSGQVMRAPA